MRNGAEGRRFAAWWRDRLHRFCWDDVPGGLFVDQRWCDLVPALFPYLMNNLGRPGGLLSGGQQQQLAIARALAAHPAVLLLDEPTEGIQPNIVEEIESIILRLNRQEGLTIVLVEQNIPFARKAAHAFVMMEKGRVAASGRQAELGDDLIHRYLAV